MGTESNNIGTINWAQTPISLGVSENRDSDSTCQRDRGEAVL